MNVVSTNRRELNILSRQLQAEGGATVQSFSDNATVVNPVKSHNDVIKWKHFPRYWPFVRGIHRSPVNPPHKGQWRGALMFALMCAWINGWVNNREADDLRCHRAHYDVIVMVEVNPVKSQVYNWKLTSNRTISGCLLKVIWSNFLKSITALGICFDENITFNDHVKIFVWKANRQISVLNVHDAVTLFLSLQWRHNEHDGVSNHQPNDCLLNRLSRRRSKKTSKLRVTGLCKENSLVTGEFPSQRPVTQKMIPFDDVIVRTVLTVWLACGMEACLW